MASNAEQGSTVIAIGKDKNSQIAVKWAVEHLLMRNDSCVLIHVRTKALSSDEFDSVPKQGRPPTEEELHQLFLPFRGFCARKGIIAKELVLHDIDVSSALIDYIVDNSISNIVLGASRWNFLIRKFLEVDVASSLVKSLPESCTVHIVSKGKVQSIQPEGDSEDDGIPHTKTCKDISTPKGKISKGLSRKSFKYGTRVGSSSDGEKAEPKLSRVNSCSQNSSTRSSLAGSDASKQLGLNETSQENQGPLKKSNSCSSKSSKKSQEIMEVEIKKVNLESKKSTKKRGKASKEAVAEKQKAMENEKHRQEEQNMEKARLVEEAALALEEVERQIINAAMESETKQAEISAMHEEEERKRELNASSHKNIQFRRYNIREIEVATNFFDSTLILGEGGYGPVFKGVFDYTVFAVKVLRPDLTSGEKQFNQEVQVLRAIRHPNIIQLLGACPEYGCLVYELVDNGSLEDRLFQKDNTPPIPWKIRFKIASDIATGLLFLHKLKPEPIVHRDLKPGNILLDMNFDSKISDVGLARLVPPSVANKTTEYHLTAAAGTFCYIDPEYQQTGLLGVKSDIYSLGVLLLQLITGKPPMGVAHLVEDAVEKGKLEEVLDPNVTGWPVEETLCLASLALKCCEMRKRDRPDLGSVILPELNRLRNLVLE